MSTAIPLLPLWAFVANSRVDFTFTFTLTCYCLQYVLVTSYYMQIHVAMKIRQISKMCVISPNPLQHQIVPLLYLRRS